MLELIKILQIGFYDGVYDVLINKIYNKKYKIILNNELKSKIYDIAFIIGYNSAKEFKNSL